MRKQFTNYPSIMDIKGEIKELDDKSYEKELLKTLIDHENEKVNFQNTRNNVAISNTHRASSKMCSIM